jgi:acyl transferase domain-containing protein
LVTHRVRSSTSFSSPPDGSLTAIIGEIAASYAAHLCSRRDCMVAAYLRGKAVSLNAARGSMLAVGLGSGDTERYIQPFEGRVVQACHNSPKSVTLSGDFDSIADVKENLDADGVFARILSTGGNAYHSHHMKALGQEYEESMRFFRVSDPEGHKISLPQKKPSTTNTSKVAFFSSLSGTLNTSDLLGPAYWRSNLESPVLFDEAVSAMLCSMSIDIIAEIGPHSALQGPLRQIFQDADLDKNPQYISAMIRK